MIKNKNKGVVSLFSGIAILFVSIVFLGIFTYFAIGYFGSLEDGQIMKTNKNNLSLINDLILELKDSGVGSYKEIIMTPNNPIIISNVDSTVSIRQEIKNQRTIENLKTSADVGNLNITKQENSVIYTLDYNNIIIFYDSYDILPSAQKITFEKITEVNNISVISISREAASLEKAKVISPVENQTYTLGEPILLKGLLINTVDEYTCHWDSNVDGNLGDNCNFNFENLTVGNHEITFEAKKDNVVVSYKSVSIIIASNQNSSLTTNITSPTDSASFVYAQSIDFNSTVTDPVGTYSCSWDSNIDGNLSSNCNFSNSSLSLGSHIITLSVTDENQTLEDTVDINIINPMSVTIDSPLALSDNNFGLSIDFNSTVTNPVGSYTCSWDSNIDGNLSSECNFSNSSLSLGSHIITLSVTDDLDVNSTSIVLNIVSGCSPGYILVPGNMLYSLTDFCVSKYDMKLDVTGNGMGELVSAYSQCTTGDLIYNTFSYQNCSGLGNLVSSKEGSPVANITQTEAIAACASIGGHLITNNEWMTIVRNIEQVPSNWSNEVVGSGYIYSGHNDNVPGGALEASIDTNGYAGTGQTTGNQRRTLTLTNGEVIWDLAGNVWKWTNNTIQQKDKPDGYNNSNDLEYNSGSNWMDYSKATGGTYYLDSNNLGNTTLAYDDLFLYTSGDYNAVDNGVGVIYTYSNRSSTDTTVYGFLRGGRWMNTSNAGVLSLYMGNTSSTRHYGFGFRCVK